MKNLLLLFFFAFTTSLSAQKFGIRAGVNLASQSFGDGDVDAGSIVGYQVGINYEILTILNLAIRPGLLYATKGSSQEFPDLTEEARFHYFEVPVDIVYDLGVVDIFAGPYMGYALKGTQDVGAEVVNINFDKDNVKKLDIGLNFSNNSKVETRKLTK